MYKRQSLSLCGETYLETYAGAYPVVLARCDRSCLLYTSFISGANYLKNYIPQKWVDHIYCNLFCFYGFATWKDRWKTLDFNITCEEVIEKG